MTLRDYTLIIGGAAIGAGLVCAHWCGVVVLNGVKDGKFGLMDIPLTDICARFEGMSLARFLQRNRRNAKERYSLARAA